MSVLRPHISARGFTLLEVMVAAMILVVAMVGSIALVVGLLRGNQTTRARDTAYFLAQDTLDQLASVPLSQFPTLPENVGAAADTTPICYAEGDDAFLDHPIACNVTTTQAAYWVRAWMCCATPPAGGGLFNSPNPIPVVPPNPCSPNYNWQKVFQTIGPSAGVGTLTVPATSAACSVAVEVTWPKEPNATDLFADPFTTPLTFQNHVLLSMARSQ